MDGRAPHIPYHPFWGNPYWMGREYYRLPLQGQWGCHLWARKLLRPRIATWGHEGSRESGLERPMTKSAHRWHAVWFGAWMEHHRCHIHYTLVTRNIPCHQQNNVHGLCRSGKDTSSCTQVCHLVGSSQAWNWVAGLAQADHVWNCQKQSACWLHLS